MITTNNSLIGSSLTGVADLDWMILSIFLNRRDFKTVVSVRTTCMTLHGWVNDCSFKLFQKSITQRLIASRDKFIIKCKTISDEHFLHKINCFDQDKDLNYKELHSDMLKGNQRAKNIDTELRLFSREYFFAELINRRLNELNDREIEICMIYLKSIPSNIIMGSTPMLNSLLELIKKQKNKNSSKISQFVETIEWSYCKTIYKDCRNKNALYNDEDLTEQIIILKNIAKLNNSSTNYLMVTIKYVLAILVILTLSYPLSQTLVTKIL